MRIGILALQGDFAAHGRMLDRLGMSWREVRAPGALDWVCGLILPGGESTTMLKFLHQEGFREPLGRFLQRGGAMFGTCAGAIVLAREVTNPAQPSLKLLDVRVERNAYGRQVDSFVDSVPSPKLGPTPLEMVFIRAPLISTIGPNVEVLAAYQGHPVLVQQDQVLAATFHPELTSDTRVHQHFLSLVHHRWRTVGSPDAREEIGPWSHGRQDGG